MNKVNFTKLPLAFDKQADLLISRGLVCADRQALIDFLSYVNYFRLAGYCLSFETARHQFIEGTTFEQVRESYLFDKGLRILVMQVLEPIEVKLRTTIAYTLSHKYGVFPHEDPSIIFANADDFAEWTQRIHGETQKSKEIFISAYKQKYLDYPKIPIWVLVEILPFGSLSYMFEHLLLKDDQEAVSKDIGIHSKVLTSWFHTFSYVRNICAHHGRFWDKKLSIPSIKNREGIPNDKAFYVLFALKEIISKPWYKYDLCSWKNEVETLLSNPPKVQDFYEKIGLSTLGENWKENPIWKR